MPILEAKFICLALGGIVDKNFSLYNALAFLPTFWGLFTLKERGGGVGRGFSND
ncbi:hypothetical protein B9Z19DRAFT_1189325 [Tuber borchii]|uniref:Uncharacterized protein n=1 Tax=Tuber borchii TaxID=42251 RepID=A0A2T7A872_TUBBO|nr:hypothetical protein B9Z19DRAFT_1189325 [Tuber borchii]